MKFKGEHTFDERKAESERVRTKYPDRIPGKFFRLELFSLLSFCSFYSFL
jgi:hypothetical protein